MKKLTLTALRTLETESKRVTKACRAKMAKRRKKKARVYSAKATKITAAIEKTSFCASYKRGIKMVVEAALETKLPSLKSDTGKELTGFFVKHAVIVCTGNPNSHNYGRKPALLRSQSRRGALRMNGITGNWLPEVWVDDTPVRYATDKEVVAFFKAIRARIKSKKRVEYYS